MKRYWATLILLVAVSSAWGQAPLPGTFNTQSVQSGLVVSGPILTPPLVSFGSGLTPPVVINGQAAIVSAPQSTSVFPSMVTNQSQSGYVSTRSGIGVPSPIGAGETPATQMSAQGTENFDYVVAPSSGTSAGSVMTSGVGGTNLGEIAASMRKSPAPTQRSFTNEDIARLNGVTNNNYQMPGASTEQPAYPQQQPHSEANAPLTPGAKPSPFSPKPLAESETSTTSNAATGTEPTQLAQNTMPERPDAQQQQSGAASSAPDQAAAKRTLPASSSPLPLLAVLGTVTAAGGYILAKRR
jgi:hypothetical protein